MWNRSIKLLASSEITTNDNGFDTETETFLGGIPANFKDVTRNDEILANQKGYKADQTVEIGACNYAGQSFLVDEGDGMVYDIKRSFQKDKSLLITLVCERRT